MKTLSNSEFAQMLASMFPAVDDYRRDEISIFNENGGYAIHAKETAKGWSSVRIGFNTYNKMTAAEKQMAVEYVKTLAVEIVTEKSDVGNWTYKSYWVAGSRMQYLESHKNCWWYESEKSRIIEIVRYR